MSGQANTPFSPNSDIVAQMTGTGAPVPGAISPTYAAAVVLNALLFALFYIRILGVSATSAACAVTTTYIGPAGANRMVSCEAIGGTVTYTFGAGFKVSATAAPTIGTAICIEFVSNGTNWVEVGRSVAITT